MRYKLKVEKVIEVSKSIGSSISSATFKSYEKVEGEKLISLTNSRQVNSFIIRSLFNQWRGEVEKLESPYFDFKHEKVKEALKGFMNVLSNHISIDQSHLEPILFQAIEDAIYISFEPKQYLINVLERSDKPQDFKKQFKYIKTNREVFKSLTENISDFDTKNSIIEKFEGIEASFEKVSAEEFLNKLDSADLVESLFDKIEEPAPILALEEPKIDPVPEQKEIATEQVAEKEKSGTLNDRFDGGQKLTLAEKLQKKVNQSIESTLTLNEKFMFQSNLFGGDNAQMRAALQNIDNAQSLQEALNIANQYNMDWDMESEEVEVFMQVLERRFP